MDEKNKVLKLLRLSECLFLILSECSHMPYVVCDPHTYDDQVLLFSREEDAVKESDRLKERGEPVRVIKLTNAMLLPFYTTLFTMGVNCLSANPGVEGGMQIQLHELVTRPAGEQLPKGQIRIENPELHLTALYFVQAYRKSTGTKMTEELQELNEEMMAHFQRGRYIVAVQRGQGVPVLRQKDGQTYQPVFTDFQEFQKFNKDQKYQTAVVEADKIPKMLMPETAGVAINPLGVNVLLNIRRKKV